MPQAHGWLTPDAIPSGTRCISLYVPDDFDFMAMLKGAIVPLFDFSQYEEHGTLTPEECAQWWVDWDADNDWAACPGETMPIISEIRMFASAPPTGWLNCNGDLRNIVDYPDLYAEIGITFGGDGIDTFGLPDLRARFPVGTGDNGVVSYDRADQGGEDFHSLTVTEIPAHHHAYTRRVTTGGALGVAEVSTVANITNQPVTSDAGGGGQHENRPPFLALYFYIYAGA